MGGDEDSDSVDVGCSLGVGSPVCEVVGVGDGSPDEGAGSELGGGRVEWCVDGGLVVAGSVDVGGAVVDGGADDDGPPSELAGRDGFVGGWSADVPAGLDDLLSGLEAGGKAGKLSNVVGDVGRASGCGFGVGTKCPVGPDACER